jgi:hypothetical protein
MIPLFREDPLRKLSFSLVAIFLIGIGCGGGGGGGGGNDGGTQAELPGQYTMTGIRYEFNNGLVATEKDFVPWGGQADIGHTTLGLQMTLLGETTNVGGSYSATWSSATGGTIFDGSDSIPFTLSNGDLTLIFPDLFIDVGLTADVFIYWHKVSDSHVNLSPDRESVGTNDVNIFGSLSQFMKSVMK